MTLVRTVYRLAGSPSYLDDLRADLRKRGLIRAIASHDSTILFDWLAETLSYQGISNAIAADYMKRHGRATWRRIEQNLGKAPSCPKLKSYWHFHRCRYHKGSGTCRARPHLGLPLADPSAQERHRKPDGLQPVLFHSGRR